MRNVELMIFLLVALWPVAGLVVLRLVGRIGANKGKGVLPPPENFAEILARMYLWPIVWWRIKRSRDSGDSS